MLATTRSIGEKGSSLLEDKHGGPRTWAEADKRRKADPK